MSFYNTTPETELSQYGSMLPKLFGGPLLYSKYTDPQITVGNSKVGRTIAETILTNPTVVSICPGKCKYLGFGKSKAKKEFVNDLLGSMNDELDSSDISSKARSTFKNDSKFYTFTSAYRDYMNRVNIVARMMSVFCGIGDIISPLGCSYKSADWTGWQNNRVNIYDKNYNDISGRLNRKYGNWLKSISGDMRDMLVSEANYIHFYANTSSSYSESVSTSTRQSSLQSKFESQFDDTVKDLQFIMGSDLNSAGADLTGEIQKVLSEGGVSGSGWDALLGATKSYISGSRIVFPQMPDDVSYGKDISVTTKFVSPYANTESVFLHCLLPLAHIMAAAYPKQMDKNLYQYPFLIKLYSKGWMNCEMGIITGFSVQRGGQDDASWSSSGIATEIEVRFDVTPLISNMMVPTASNVSALFDNEGIMEYLGTICGVDMKGDGLTLKLKTIEAMGSSILAGNPIRSGLRALGDTGLANAIRSIQNLP